MKETQQKKDKAKQQSDQDNITSKYIGVFENEENNDLAIAKQKAQGIYEQNINKFQQFHDESIKKYNQWIKKKEHQSVEILKKENESKKKNEMNLDLDYWKKKFLYPYALDIAPLKNNDGSVT